MTPNPVNEYARLVVFMRDYTDALRAQSVLSTEPAQRCLERLIDTLPASRAKLLALAHFVPVEADLSHHLVGTALLCLAAGHDLGFTRLQLRDLAVTALFHDVGVAQVPQAILQKPGVLSKEDKAVIARSRIGSIRAALFDQHLNRTTLLRAVTTFEHKGDFKAEQGVYARLIAIVSTYHALTSPRPYRDAYAPEVALTIMFTELRARFDPALLRALMRVVGVPAVRIARRTVKT